MPFDPARPPIPTERIKQSYTKLSSVAIALNSSSDKLNASITRLEEELKKLGLGVSTGYTFRKADSGGSVVTDELWYAKVNSKWMLAIKTRTTDPKKNDQKVEMWPFAESPRQLRVLAIPAIPDLLDQLAKVASGMISEIDARSADVGAMTAALAQKPSAPPKVAPKPAVNPPQKPALPVVHAHQKPVLPSVNPPGGKK